MNLPKIMLTFVMRLERSKSEWSHCALGYRFVMNTHEYGCIVRTVLYSYVYKLEERLTRNQRSHRESTSSTTHLIWMALLVIRG